MVLDEIDLKILEILQKNGRTRRSDLASIIGLSIPAASERMRKLEEEGFIVGYYARLDPLKLGKGLTAFVLVTVDSSRHYPAFIEHVKPVDEIMECHSITGEGTHLLKIRCEDTQTLEKLLARIQAWQGVVKTTTNVVLSPIKESLHAKIPRTAVSKSEHQQR
jgi:Lrp/AsnC family transcriptional regulator, leucine-responsive regulatory protein